MKLAFIFLSLWTSHSFGMTPKEIYKQSLSYVGYVKTPDGHGSGFFLKNGIFATNEHVISGSSEKDISVELQNGKVFKNPILLYKNKNEDIALLLFDAAPHGFKLSEKFEVADKIFVLGNPKDFKFSFTDGLISRLSENDGIQTIQFSAPILLGSSGSPIINDSGEVIGIVKSKYSNEDFAFGTGTKNFVMALTTTHKLINSYGSLVKECRAVSTSCMKLGELLSEAGLFQSSLGAYSKACDKRILKGCYEASTLKLTIGITDIDEFKKEVSDLCKLGDTKSCQTESSLKDKTSLTNNILSSKGFEIKFPQSFRIYHKDHWKYVKDEFLRSAHRDYSYQLGGWVTKTSFFTGKTSERVYAFIENIPLSAELLTTFSEMSFKEVPLFYRDLAIKGLEERSKKAEVVIKKVKNSFPYFFILETKYLSGGVKKDLYIFGDNSGIVKVTFSGSNSESSNIDTFIKQTIKGMSIKDKRLAIVFDANRKFRIIFYVALLLLVTSGILFFLQRKYRLITRIYAHAQRS